MAGVITLQLPCLAKAQANKTPPGEIVFHTFKRETDSPVFIDHLEIDGKFIPMDTPVRVKPGWLSKLVVVVENSSPKTVVEGGVQVDFPETGSGTTDSPILATASNVGQYPSWAKYRSDGTIQNLPHRPEIKVPAGGTLDFTLPDASTEGTEAEAQRRVGQVTRVTIKLLRFYFQDSSAWARGGYFWVPDKQPGKSKRISVAEFYSMSAN